MTAAAVGLSHSPLIGKNDLEVLFRGIYQVPVLPVFVNGVATPLSPMSRIRALGTAIGEATASLAATSGYTMSHRFYRAIPEWIAGFAVATASQR